METLIDLLEDCVRRYADRNALGLNALTAISGRGNEEKQRLEVEQVQSKKAFEKGQLGGAVGLANRRVAYYANIVNKTDLTPIQAREYSRLKAYRRAYNQFIPAIEASTDPIQKAELKKRLADLAKAALKKEQP